MRTDQRLWRVVTTLTIGGALLTLVMLLWLGRGHSAHHPVSPATDMLSGSAYQNGAPVHRASYDGPMPVMTPLPYVRPANGGYLPTLLGP